MKRLYGIFLTLTSVRFNFTLKQEKLINIVIDHALQQWSFSGPVKPNELAKWSERNLNPRPLDFTDVQRPNHSATVSTCCQMCYTLALYASLVSLFPGFLSSKGGKRKNVRIEGESLARIWRVIN